MISKEGDILTNGMDFIVGESEMRSLIREHDWSHTVLGAADGWSQTLKIILSTILDSRFPKFLFWGDDLLCFYNDAYRPSLGFMGKHPWCLGRPGKEVWPETWDVICPLIEQVRSGGGATYHEDLLIPFERNNTVEDTYWTFSYSAVRDEKGAIHGILVACTETTAKVLAAKELAKNRDELAFAIEAAELGTYEYDPLTKFFSANQRTREWFGLPLQATIDLEDAIVAIPETERQCVMDAIKNALFNHQDGQYDIEHPIKHPVTNKKITVRAKGRGWFNNEGVAYRFNGTLQDITNEAAARQQILESEGRFRSMAEAIDIMISVTDGFGNETYLNSAWTRFTGKETNDLLGMKWTDLIHPDDRKDYIDSHKEVHEKCIDHSCELRLIDKKGDYIWHLAKGRPRLLPDGTFAGFVRSYVDIHEQKLFADELKKQIAEHTRELEQKNTELNRMNTELQSFSYIASHDLQEPLRKIQSFSGTILQKESLNLSDKGKDYLVRMNDAAERMKILINDLLEYSSLADTGQAFETTDLNMIVNGVIKELEESLASRKAEVIVEGLFEASIIPFQFRQLFHNLIGNSLKFSSPERTPVITIKGEKVPSVPDNGQLVSANGFYHIRFGDNGIGFDPLYKDKIFDVFQRLHSKQDFKGTGIGLAIVKKVVNNHNGTIIASGKENDGATFDIYFPID